MNFRRKNSDPNKFLADFMYINGNFGHEFPEKIPVFSLKAVSSIFIAKFIQM